MYFYAAKMDYITFEENYFISCTYRMEIIINF